MVAMSRALIQLPQYRLDSSAQPLIAGAALLRTVIVVGCAAIAALAIALSAGGDRRSVRKTAAEAADFQHLELTGFTSASRERGADLALLTAPAALFNPAAPLFQHRYNRLKSVCLQNKIDDRKQYDLSNEIRPINPKLMSNIT